MRFFLALLSAVLLAPPLLLAQASGAKTLDIYFIDVEGGQATLYVSPDGESVLVDTGFPGERDNQRIIAALQAAGVTQIDYLVTTHYHGDHMGGLLELARRVPIRHYVDHGPSVERGEQTVAFEGEYAPLHGNALRTVARPGDRLPVAGLDWRIVASAGEVVQVPLPGAGAANAACPAARPEDRPGENPQSVGSVVSYGRFRTINLGDLPAGGEFDLVCPIDRIGLVDLYLTSHHGLSDAGNEMLLHAVRPRAAVMNNGPRKGGTPEALQRLYSAAGLEDVWQLHWSHHAGIEYNAPGLFIANLDDPGSLAAVVASSAGETAESAATGEHPGAAYLIKVSALPDGTFTITNSRNGFSKTYSGQPQARVQPEAGSTPADGPGR